MNGLIRGYWCECWTENVSTPEGPTLLASFDAYSAPQADRWVTITLRTISPTLDSASSDEAWTLLHDERAETRRALLHSEPCTVTIKHGDVRITWTIQPVLFLPLAHRQDAELPACAHTFKPRTTD